MGSLLLSLHGPGGHWVPGRLRADDDAAVGDARPVPACPVLGVFAAVLEEDVTDTWRVIRESVGDLEGGERM